MSAYKPSRQAKKRANRRAKKRFKTRTSKKGARRPEPHVIIFIEGGFWLQRIGFTTPT